MASDTVNCSPFKSSRSDLLAGETFGQPFGAVLLKGIIVDEAELRKAFGIVIWKQDVKVPESDQSLHVEVRVLAEPGPDGQMRRVKDKPAVWVINGLLGPDQTTIIPFHVGFAFFMALDDFADTAVLLGSLRGLFGLNVPSHSNIRN